MQNRSIRSGSTSLPGGHSVLVPPDPIPNSEVKRLSADDSVGFPHAKVGHCQVLFQTPDPKRSGVFLCLTVHLFLLLVSRGFLIRQIL